MPESDARSVRFTSNALWNLRQLALRDAVLAYLQVQAGERGRGRTHVVIRVGPVSFCLPVKVGFLHLNEGNALGSSILWPSLPVAVIISGSQLDHLPVTSFSSGDSIIFVASSDHITLVDFCSLKKQKNFRPHIGLNVQINKRCVINPSPPLVFSLSLCVSSSL